MSTTVRWIGACALAWGCSDYELNHGKDNLPGDSAALDSGSPLPPDCDDMAAPAAPTADQDKTCLREPVAGTLDPVVEWNSDALGLYATDAHIKHPYITPVVGNLTDDNGDGVVDRKDIPDIAYTVYANSSETALRVISGDGTREHLYLPEITWDGQSYPIAQQGGVAIGDIDSDGSPDIVTFVGNGAASTAWPIALERDGTVKWVQLNAETSRYSYPSLADLDGDGQAEVVVGQYIIDTDGTLIASGTGGTGTPDSNPWPSWGSISIPMDLDGDGILEIVAGNTIYDAEGSTVASSGEADGFTAVADVDVDGAPEIVTSIHSTGELYLWEADGAVTWKTATGSGGGGSPTIADFDGDGLPEIGVAGKTAYTVLESDGTVKWQSAITDYSSSATGSSVFDFDGDGASEVVFADEVSFFIFDGSTGAVLYENTDHSHGTAWEYPVVVDVDNDGAVEVVLGSVDSSGTGWNGVTVIGSATDSWMPARTIWNQHAYNITNVTEDGGIPSEQSDNWDKWNTFRAAGQESGPSEWLVNVQPVDASLCVEACAAEQVTLYVTATNSGLREGSDVLVSLRDEAGREVAADVVAVMAAGSGAVVGPMVIDRDTWGDGALSVVVDPDEVIEECDEGDNTLSIGLWPCEM